MSGKDVGVVVSTQKGAVILRSDENRDLWDAGDRFLPEEDVNKVIIDSNHKMYAATLSEGVFTSDDSGRTWKQSSRGLNVRKVWSLAEDAHESGVIFAGTQYGHLFRSDNSGGNWTEVVGLHNAPGRNEWGVDWGFGTTGLTIHTIISDPEKRDRLFLIASGKGIYRSDDGGETWVVLKDGLKEKCPVSGSNMAPGIPDGDRESKIREHLEGVHSCSHKIVISPRNHATLYQQNHCGVYVSSDSGNTWTDISPGNHLRHGFPVDAVRDNVFVIPSGQGLCERHNSCIQGQLSVYTTADSGKHWKREIEGLPGNVHTAVLRDSFSHDTLDVPGVYFGTTTGEVYCSTDLGQNWRLAASGLGRIQGISAMVS
jgi:photosystem II stability/assembly factor-like uncharacterized protein